MFKAVSFILCNDSLWVAHSSDLLHLLFHICDFVLGWHYTSRRSVLSFERKIIQTKSAASYIVGSRTINIRCHIPQMNDSSVDVSLVHYMSKLVFGSMILRVLVIIILTPKRCDFFFRT